MNVKPVNLSAGGLIKWPKDAYNPHKNDLQNDNYRVMLEVGSLVIPKPVMPLMNEYLSKHGQLTVPKIIDSARLVECIVMPQEYIVPKKYAKPVLAFLLDNGVSLPIPHDTLI
jgi:hypothetical protein